MIKIRGCLFTTKLIRVSVLLSAYRKQKVRTLIILSFDPFTPNVMINLFSPPQLGLPVASLSSGIARLLKDCCLKFRDMP